MIKVKKDLTGQIFGKLQVIEQAEDYISPGGKHYSQWLCECSCINKKRIIVPTNRLNSGQTKSCGCLRKKNNREKVQNEYILDLEDEYGKYGIGICSNSNTKFYFDMIDYDIIKVHLWREESVENYNRVRTTKNSVCFSIPQIILGDWYDHIDRNPFNNRRYNLRKVSPQENCLNRSLQQNNTSGVTGVYFENYTKKWRAHIEYKGVKMFLGRYSDKDEAIKARLRAEKEYFKEFAPQKDLYEQYGI